MPHPRVRRAAGAVLVALLAAGAAGCSVEGADPGQAPEQPSLRSTPPSSPTWAATFARVRGGVGRVSAVSCEESGSGSGFLVSRRELMTAAHVVAGAVVLSVRFDGAVVGATVVGRDDAADLALLRLDDEVPGHVFAPATEPAEVGADVAALGYPLGRPIAMAQGTVVALGQEIEADGEPLADLVQTDTSVNPGNSGGPLVAADGTVLGVVAAASEDAVEGYAVEQPVFTAALDRWRGRTAAVRDRAAQGCDPAAPTAGGDPVEVRIGTDAPEALEVAQFFKLHAESINDGYYEQAWEQYTKAARRGYDGGYDGFAEDLDSVYWVDLEVLDVDPVDAVTNSVLVAFTTEQDADAGPDGQVCSHRRVRYRMALDAGDWQIDRAVAQGGPQAC